MCHSISAYSFVKVMDQVSALLIQPMSEILIDHVGTVEHNVASE